MDEYWHIEDLPDMRKHDYDMARYRKYQETADAVEALIPAYARQMRLDAMGALSEAYDEVGYECPVWDNGWRPE